MRSEDGSSTPLGAPTGWPQALRTALRLLLSSDQPMCLWWGSERLWFENDAYRQSIGSARHPASVGRPAPEVAPEEWAVIGPQVEAVMAGHGGLSGGSPLPPVHREGHVENVRWTCHCHPIDDDTAPGGIGGVLALWTIDDGDGPGLTDRIATESRSRDDENRFGEVANAAPVMMWMSDRTGARVGFNTSWLRFTGRTLEQETNEGWADGVHPDDRDACLRVYREAFDRREPFRMDYRQRRHDGEWRTLDDHASPRLSDEGAFLGYVGSCVDVTDQRAAEAALRRSEEQLRLATEASEVGLWDVDVLTDTLFWPARVKAMFGISPEVDVSMADFYAGLHPDDAEHTAASYLAAADPARRSVYQAEYRTIGKEDGVTRWVAAKGRGVFDASGRCVRMIGTALDITERKAAEQRLRDSEARLSEAVATLDALISSAPIGFAFFDRDYRYVRVNGVLAATNGKAVENLIGRPMGEVSPVNAKVVIPKIAAVFDTGRGIDSFEMDGETPSHPGVRRSWLTSFFPVESAAGHVAFVGVTVVDITARRRAEEAVRRLNETLESQVAARTLERDRVWRNSRDLLVVIGPDDRFEAVSPSWTTILGHPPDEVIGRRFDAFRWPPDHAEEPLPSGFADLSADWSDFEADFCHRDGSHRSISWRMAIEGGLVFGYGRDITAEKEKDAALARTEEALRQSQKMEAVGHLTGGLAHDFNNLLAAISGSLELLRRRHRQGRLEEVGTFVESALRSSKRAAALTQRLLAFARRQTLDPRPAELNRVIAGMDDLIRRTIGPAVEVEVVGAGGLWTVLVDVSQLENALLNLCINARDAMMPAGGRLTIETANKWLDERAARERDLPPGQYVSLCVTDTGTGMTPEVMERAFDPFFTTKPMGEGTGLGLSMIYGFVRQSGGQVRIYSELGIGTTMCLYFPRYVGGLAPSEPLKPPAEDVSGSGYRILVVDDEPTVRLVLREVLTDAGFAVLEADSGPGAFELLRQGAAIDLLITDVGLPGGMNGRQLADAIRVSRPDLKVLFITGYAENAVVGNGHLDAGMEVLTKPFEMSALTSRVQRMIDGLDPVR